MRTRQMFSVMIVAVLAGTPAAAQVPPVPPPPPQVPAPLVLPGLVLPDLLALEDLRLRMPELRRSLDDLRFELDGRLFDFTEFQDATREATRDAIQAARQAMQVDRQAIQLDRQDHLVYSTQGGDYSAGKDLLGRSQYEQAITRFDRVIARKAANVDGALYWKAYAQFKLARTDDALATIALLRKDHPQSRYNADAKVLESDVRKMAGQPVNPANLADDELKVLAIQGLQRTDPERAVPLLEGVLNATNSLKVKRQALYVLALSSQPRARQILLDYAKGAGNPDLQIEAIRYFTANRNKQTTSAELMQIYQSTQDMDVKLAVISSLRTSGDHAALVSFVGSSTTPAVLRSSALSSAASRLSAQELWTLYEKESNKDLKIQMVALFGSMDAVDQLSRIVKTEKDADVRRRAIRALGGRKVEKSGQLLVDLYAAEQDAENRRSIISALASQNNAEGLVAIARKETTLSLKTEIVRRLSDMAPKSKVAADYLMEIIK